MQKRHKKKITVASITSAIAIVILFLTLIEKTEALIARIASRNPADPITNYSLDKYTSMNGPTNEQAKKLDAKD